MQKKIRPLILIIEKSEDPRIYSRIISESEKLMESFNKKSFIGSKNRDLRVNVFEFSQENCLVEHILYKPGEISDLHSLKQEKKNTVCLDVLVRYLNEMRFLNNKSVYLQPIVLFMLDGTKQ